MPSPTSQRAAGGFRLHSCHDRDGSRARLISRNGHDLTYLFPPVAAAIAALPVQSCLIDGEAIVCDGNGLALRAQGTLIRHPSDLARTVPQGFTFILSRKPSTQREIRVHEESGQDSEAPSGLTPAEKAAFRLARRRSSDHNSCMDDETDLHLEITRGPPFWREIYRGDDPQWVERSMFGYLIEREALQDGQAALQCLINREAQAKRTTKPTDKAR